MKFEISESNIENKNSNNEDNQPKSEDEQRGDELLDMILGPDYDMPDNPADAFRDAFDRVYTYYEDNFRKHLTDASNIYRTSKGTYYPESEIKQSLKKMREDQKLAHNAIRRRFFIESD